MLPGGQLVVGNFGNVNPTRGYMEALVNWYLEHRSDDQLRNLARSACDSARDVIEVRSEATGVNRFLHVARGKKSVRIDRSQKNQPHRMSATHIFEQP